ncbi:chaperonin 10-like protein, partial [Copromyces sp. CBS 386.78]
MDIGDHPRTSTFLLSFHTSTPFHSNNILHPLIHDANGTNPHQPKKIMTEPTPSLPASMQALRITSFGAPYTQTSIPVPSPSTLRPHDLLVKVAVASHCHTDTIIRLGAVPSIPLPLTGSHEGSGTVVAVGSSVAADGSFKPGDRVMCGIPLGLCGSCVDCTAAGGGEHYKHYCAHIDGHIGIQVDGVFAEYAVVDSRTSTVIPEGVSLLAAAPLGCAGRTAWRAVKEAGLQPGQW